MDRKTHWEEVYRSRAPEEVSWYQLHSQRSLDLVRAVAPGRDAAILDVGGGASTLVDDLIAEGFHDPAVLDLSGAALARAQERLGPHADRVRWIEADVLELALPQAGTDVWHDRAVFHFLTAADDRARYAGQVRRSLKPGGHLVIATFAEDGPARCSGLEVQRHSADSLQAVFGAPFALVRSERETHLTPAGGQQAFLYCVFRLRPEAGPAEAP